jgi:hypothetical protein
MAYGCDESRRDFLRVITDQPSLLERYLRHRHLFATFGQLSIALDAQAFD